VIAHEVEQQMRLAALAAEMNIGEEQGAEVFLSGPIEHRQVSRLL